ncbi:hypothetical protein RIR_jg2022.t1 [Rhizophagus irregularis DAOM 181602=DAOM 197198]|nr:hypothetical protein RIR_jg2022.t1 [Rhizophagus irregularis DAOM 181602=DAOM 197198]
MPSIKNSDAIARKFIRYTVHCISACDKNLVTEIYTMIMIFLAKYQMYGKNQERHWDCIPGSTRRSLLHIKA